MRCKIRRGYVIALAVICTVVIAFFEYAGISFSEDETFSRIISMTITRGTGALLFTVLLFYLGYNIHNFRNPGRTLLFSLPCFAVVINNLPIIALVTGSAYVTAPHAHVLMFALECLFIGIFEETAFRGAIYLMLLEKRHSDKKQIFTVTVVSSLIFGAIHLFNLFAGAGFGPTVMQVGYSFLIGGMCSVVLLKTRNIWLCALLHAIYDFCGFLLPRLGDGSWWDTPTVIITAVLAVCVTVYMVWLLFTVKPEDVDKIYY